jgi:hypothetical protein
MATGWLRQARPLLDALSVPDADGAAAVTGSFLRGLPSGLVDELLAAGDRRWSRGSCGISAWPAWWRPRRIASTSRPGRTARPVGDLTYEAALLERRQLPGVGNRRQLSETTEKVLALAARMPGLVVLPAHDPTAARRLFESQVSGSSR